MQAIYNIMHPLISFAGVFSTSYIQTFQTYKKVQRISSLFPVFVSTIFLQTHYNQIHAKQIESKLINFFVSFFSLSLGTTITSDAFQE